MEEILLPELGEGITEAAVACWHCAPGDRVGPDVDVAEVVTDKAVFCIPAGVNGVIAQICVPAGQNARVGQALARVEPQSAGQEGRGV